LEVNIKELKPASSEILRYMGWKRKMPGDETYDNLVIEIEEKINEILSKVSPKFEFTYVNIEENKELCEKLFVGENINRFICDNEGVYLAVATLGFQFENILKSAGAGNALDLLMLEAVGTELVEKLMDYIEELIKLKMDSTKSSRFSPGYGEWELFHQQTILDFLRADRIGVYLNESNLMIPRKSVTAVIKMDNFDSGCKFCNKKNCEFKKNI